MFHLTLIGDEPPTEVRLFPFGKVATEKGTFKFTPTSARLILARFKRWNIDFGFDYDHGTLDPKVPPKDREASGWATTTSNRPGGLEIRNDGLWATGIQWTADGYTKIKQKKFRYLSPGNVVTDQNGEIVDLWNCALVNLPATHGALPLVLAQHHFSLTLDENGKGKRIDMTTQATTPVTPAAPGATSQAVTPPATAPATPVAEDGKGEFFSLLGQYCSGMLNLLQENMSNPDPNVTDTVSKFMNSDFAKIATEFQDAAKAANPGMMNATLAKPALALSLINAAEKFTGKTGMLALSALLTAKFEKPAVSTNLGAQVEAAINKEFDRAVLAKKMAPGDESRKRFLSELSGVSLSLRADMAKQTVDGLRPLSEQSLTAENLSVTHPNVNNTTTTTPTKGTEKSPVDTSACSPGFSDFLKSIPDPE